MLNIFFLVRIFYAKLHICLILIWEERGGGRGGGSMQILFYIQPTLSQKYAEKFGLELMIVYHRSYQ